MKLRKTKSFKWRTFVIFNLKYVIFKTLQIFTFTQRCKLNFSGAQSELTEGKLSDLLARTKVEEAENLNMQEWRGKKIAIRNEKVRLFLLNYREFCDEGRDLFTLQFSCLNWIEFYPA